VALIAAVATMLVPAARTIQGWVCRVDTPATWDYGPAQLALRVNMYLRGIPLYRDFRTPPYVPMVYGPIVPWITAALAPRFGTGPLAALEAGRCVVIVSTLAVCALIYALARKSGAGGCAAAVAALAFLCAPIVQRWGFDFRVDMPALACEFGGVLAFASGLAAPAIGLFATAFFIKQGQIAGIAGVVLYHCISRRPWRALAPGAAWLAAVGGAIGILARVYPWYWLNSFDALSGAPYDLRGAILWMTILVGGNPALVVLAMLAVSRRRESGRGANPGRLMLCYLGAALIENFLSSLHWGSNAYYFTPSLAAIAVFAAGGIEFIFARISFKQIPAIRAAVGVAAALALLFGYLIATPAIRGMTLAAVVRPSLRCAVVVPQPWDPAALARLKAIDGPILTDAADLCVIDPRTNLQFIELMLMNPMHAAGSFDDSQLIAEIRERRIAAFALDADGLGREFRGRPLFWPALRAAIERNYVRLAEPAPPYLMVPKGAQSR